MVIEFTNIQKQEAVSIATIMGSYYRKRPTLCCVSTSTNACLLLSLDVSVAVVTCLLLLLHDSGCGLNDIQNKIKLESIHDEREP